MSQPRCVVCGTSLSAGRSRISDTCGNGICVTRARLERERPVLAAAVQKAAEERSRLERELWARVRAQLLAQLDADPAAADPSVRTVAGLVPYNARAVVPLPPERGERFLAHLTDLLHQLESAPVDPATTVLEQAEAESMPLSIQRGACALCRGHCCQTGREHAYQDLPSLRSFVARHPDLDAEAIVARYRAQLPVESYQDACVFQGGAGCVLPRSMRSITCNRFLCPDLKSLAKDVAEGADQVFVGASDGTHLLGTALFPVHAPPIASSET